MGRMIIRIVMMSGFSALLNWWTRRQERNAIKSGQDSQIARDQARRQSRTMRQALRLMRRFMRF